ncbi:hypothetical protein I79_010303 [Cricetulus griseus]|uniref:Uncharacterized protein n=1 Tax=Cricetulus griseus TaxID=10029 RepID=G3HI38_CRIGR|nr:hypothetical protein I79_010303 [Cricetulus griseus]
MLASGAAGPALLPVLPSFMVQCTPLLTGCSTQCNQLYKAVAAACSPDLLSDVCFGQLLHYQSIMDINLCN